jgi:hypothetical protein
VKHVFVILRYLELYPNGNNERTQGHIGIFLCLKSASGKCCISDFFCRLFNIRLSSCLNFTAKFKFGIISTSGIINWMNEYTVKGSEFEGGRGAPSLIQHDRLFRKKSFVPENTFSVACEVKATFF